MDTTLFRKRFDEIKSDLPSISYHELQQHGGCIDNMPLWTVFYGDIVCDVTKWTKIHPGGCKLIKMICGREGTQLFEAYHHYNVYNRVQNVLLNQLDNKNIKIIGQFVPNATEKEEIWIREYPGCGESKFYSTLSHRIDVYLKQNKIPYYGYTPLLNMLELIIFPILYLITIKLSWYHYTYYLEYLCAIFNGILQARCGFLMHTANHHGFQFSLANSFGFLVFQLIGMDTNLWLIKHQMLHHVAPNILGFDQDIGTSSLIRMHPKQKRKPIHKLQWIYVPILVNIAGINWYVNEIKLGIKFILKGKDCIYNIWTLHSWFISKLIPLFTYFILKKMLIENYDENASNTLLIFLVYAFVASDCNIGIFIVNHVQSDLFYNNNNTKHWSELNVMNSSNWSSGSTFWCWISGGLNHQIEHHLFPSMHHQNYAVIAPIVEQTCKEFNIPYRDQGNYIQAFAKVIDYLYKMGRMDVCTE